MRIVHLSGDQTRPLRNLLPSVGKKMPDGHMAHDFDACTLIELYITSTTSWQEARIKMVGFDDSHHL